MKTIQHLVLLALTLSCGQLFAQVQINKPIQLTGGSGERVITNLETPVNGTDAVNKDYVDAAVAAAGGGMPTEVSDESVSTMHLGDAARYCRNSSEGGHTDWQLPTYDELMHVISTGGITVPNEASANNIWFQPESGDYRMHYGIRLSDGLILFDHPGNFGSFALRARCVR